MNKKKIVFLLLIALLFSFYLFSNRKDNESQVKEVEVKTDLSELKKIITSYLGTPYRLGPLGEGVDKEIYRDDVFDCTTFVLVSVSNLHSDNPQQMIKQINYYPPGEVSYQTRLHFSSYRNKVSDYFEDITAQVGGSYAKSKEILLNKGDLINIDWQKNINLKYIEKEDVGKVIQNLPRVAGVMFIKDGDQEIGLDVRHEGFILDNRDLIHASSTFGEVRRENFLDYLQKSSYDAVNFYKIN
jgi:hypothetical protein